MARIVAIVVGVTLATSLSGVWMSGMGTPRGKAARRYGAGGRLVMAQDYKGGQAAFKEALDLDPTMSEAAFMSGMCCIQFRNEDEAAESFKALLEKAKNSDTRTLDDCDDWMRDCIKRCDDHPTRKPVDRSLGTTPRVKSSALAMLSVTALLRGAAAAELSQTVYMRQWLDESGKYLQQAEATDAGNSMLKPFREQYDQVRAAAGR
jgi:hypothetical protein